MKRLTESMFRMLNVFYAKDGEVWVESGGPAPDYKDCTLVEWILRAAKAHNMDISSTTADDMGEEMYDCLYHGSDTIEGIVAHFHMAAVQAAELWARLKAIEDILGDDYDLDRLKEMVAADRDGKLHIGRCLECAHYEGLAVCKYLGECGGTDWICGWFEPKKEETHENHT